MTSTWIEYVLQPIADKGERYKTFEFPNEPVEESVNSFVDKFSAVVCNVLRDNGFDVEYYVTPIVSKVDIVGLTYFTHCGYGPSLAQNLGSFDKVRRFSQRVSDREISSLVELFDQFGQVISEIQNQLYVYVDDPEPTYESKQDMARATSIISKLCNSASADLRSYL